MDHSSSKQSIRLLLLCSFLFGLNDLALADPPYTICSNNTSSNSSFQNNLNHLLSLISSGASVSKFNMNSYKNGTDRVYGQYMCPYYVSYETCDDCISVASKSIMYLCPNRTEAVIWEEVCQLRYSYTNFYGQVNVSDSFCRENIMNISDPIHFQSFVEKKLKNLTIRAAFNASANMYAAEGEPYTADNTVYAMVQCTQDLSPDDCTKCLEAAIEKVSSDCYASRGARLLGRSCYLRYEFYAFYEGAHDSYVAPKTEVTKGGSGRKVWMIVVLTTGSAFLVILLLASTIYCVGRKKGTGKVNTDLQNQYFEGLDELRAHNSYIDLQTIKLATDNFSDSKQLGQGGFGPVYKGVLPDGKEVAIKRLSSFSEQGTLEFTNEVLLILKLQHKNLVRLLGFCVDQQEKLLVYEFLPNSSLDVVLFDSKKRAQLNWRRRLNIINGIARGILYLHEDSRLRIVHRDIKASNVLLDYDMNPKISDFGLARIFAGADSEANTARIVGTCGYMAPEYAMEGLYSIKSDVFSFGVLLLEIITGRRNAVFRQAKRVPSLVAYAWHLWNEGNALELMDPLLTEGSPDEFLRLIHIGLLCVEEDAVNRPTMSSVVVMLKGETVGLCQPQQPAFSVARFADHHQMLAQSCSVSGLTISDIAPR